MVNNKVISWQKNLSQNLVLELVGGAAGVHIFIVVIDGSDTCGDTNAGTIFSWLCLLATDVDLCDVANVLESRL